MLFVIGFNYIVTQGGSNVRLRIGIEEHAMLEVHDSTAADFISMFTKAVVKSEEIT